MKLDLVGKYLVGLGLAVGLLCYGGPAQAVTLDVCSSGCTYSTIHSAINDAVSSIDEVLVDDGIYTENINFLGKAITVQSVNGATNTIIDGNANGSVVTFANSETNSSILSGFTIRNGNGTELWGNGYFYGGGIICQNSSSPIITNCIIIDNSTNWNGGGVYCDGSSSPTITNCTINYNSTGRSLLYCIPCNAAMIHSYTSKSPNRQYRYYVCSKAQKNGWSTCPTKSLPAAEIEHMVNEAGLLAVKEAIANNVSTNAVQVSISHFIQVIDWCTRVNTLI